MTYPKLSNLYEEIKKNYKKNLSQNELQFLVPDRKRGYSGSSYAGDMINDQRHGLGTMTYNNGRQYFGEWKNDQRHG